jgi:hypothetical protein
MLSKGSPSISTVGCGRTLQPEGRGSTRPSFAAKGSWAPMRLLADLLGCLLDAAQIAPVAQPFSDPASLADGAQRPALA